MWRNKLDLKTLKLNVDIAREALRVAERTYVDALATKEHNDVYDYVRVYGPVSADDIAGQLEVSSLEALGALAALHAQGIARLFDEDPVSMCSLRFELCPRRKTG
jgi:hypothetical protein